MQWNRRSLLSGLGAIGAGSFWMPPTADALGLPTDKIKAVHYFRNAGDSAGRGGQPMVNQSTNVVIIETESGLRGIGEGGEPRTMEECAAMMIGLDPFRIDMHWQRMMRGMHYTAGREKLHSLGGLDMALWELSGKSREYIECYSTAFPWPKGQTIEQVARACREAGFRVYRHATDIGGGPVVDRFALVRRMYNDCLALQKGAGDGGWALDFHTQFDPADAIRLCTMIEAADLHPYFIEDLIRSENTNTYETVRQRTRLPIAMGEQLGYKWDIAPLIQKQLIDYVRTSLPNVGGISEYMKIIGMAETHYVGMIPHFTSPIAEAALVHCLIACSVPALMEILGDGSRSWPYLTRAYDFKNGKMWPNQRPGLGVEVDVSKLTKVGEYNSYRAGMPLNTRPDGSYTQW
jgi:L-alanine-DL-glutamate epimerase-like enolase superfamily enzyme